MYKMRDDFPFCAGNACAGAILSHAAVQLSSPSGTTATLHTLAARP